EVNLPLPRLSLMTATATAAVLEDIRQAFATHDLPLGHLIQPPTSRRDNLALRVVPATGQKLDRFTALVHAALTSHAESTGGAILVYTTTRNSAETLAAHLSDLGISSSYYHGKLARDDKREVLSQFKSRELNVVVATCAFGMGINRADVRAVIHYTM